MANSPAQRIFSKSLKERGQVAISRLALIAGEGARVPSQSDPSGSKVHQYPELTNHRQVKAKSRVDVPGKPINCINAPKFCKPVMRSRISALRKRKRP